MINFFKIVIKNGHTFYNYATSEKLPRSKRLFLKLSLALILVLFFGSFSEGLLNITLAIFSILLGFSFNILFYLTTSDSNLPETKIESLELKGRLKKLKLLTGELFFNVSYFNLIAILLILTALGGIILKSPSILTSFKLDEIWNSEVIMNMGKDISEYWAVIKPYASALYNFLFYLILIECIYTFLRIIGRVSYFFDQKIKVKHKIEELEKSNSSNNEASN